MDTEWKSKYPKKTKPAYNELLDFFVPHIRELFLEFDREMREQFKVHNKYHRYLPTAGWVYGYGRSYNVELLALTIGEDCFTALGISVKDKNTLLNAIEEAKKAYNDGFEERYTDVCVKRRANQIERSKRRVEREKNELEELSKSTAPDKLNKFKWCKKVSRSDLLRLYKGEAKGLIDEILLDDIGLTFYLRCKQAKEARECMDKGQIICHHCGVVLKVSGYSTITNCPCGYSYTYREYRRSCNAVNMPGGRAEPIFDNYLKKWQGCRTTKDKMFLIDWLIHECHVTLMSGEKGRSVCINLIEGTLKQLYELIMKLAYGNN